MKLSLLTREYPPSIYGGAGVHVAQLVPQLRKFIDVDVHCMGELQPIRSPGPREPTPR